MSSMDGACASLLYAGGVENGGAFPAKPPIGSGFLSNVCMHMKSTGMLTTLPKHVCVLCKDVRVEPPLGWPPLLFFKQSPL